MFGILIVHCRACNYLLSLLHLLPEELLHTENDMLLAVALKRWEQLLGAGGRASCVLPCLLPGTIHTERLLKGG